MEFHGVLRAKVEGKCAIDSANGQIIIEYIHRKMDPQVGSRIYNIFSLYMICGITIFTPSFPFGCIFFSVAVVVVDSWEGGDSRKRWHYTFFLYSARLPNRIATTRKIYNLYLLRYMNGVIKILPIPLTPIQNVFKEPTEFCVPDSISHSPKFNRENNNNSTKKCDVRFFLSRSTHQKSTCHCVVYSRHGTRMHL